MEGMKAKLFGAPMILANGQKLELPYKKADALLYYLIYNGKVSRTQAVELLWPDVNAQTALKNLRHAIYSIRKELGWDPFLGGQRSMLELNPALELDCDVLEFLKSGDPDRYGGEFLKDFAVPKALRGLADPGARLAPEPVSQKPAGHGAERFSAGQLGAGGSALPGLCGAGPPGGGGGGPADANLLRPAAVPQGHRSVP